MEEGVNGIWSDSQRIGLSSIHFGCLWPPHRRRHFTNKNFSPQLWIDGRWRTGRHKQLKKGEYKIYYSETLINRK